MLRHSMGLGLLWAVGIAACGPAIEPSADAGGGGATQGEDGDTDTGAQTGPQTDPGETCSIVLGTDPAGAGAPDIHDGWAYWSTRGGSIMRSPLDAALPEPLATTGETYVDLSVAGSAVTYTAQDRVERIDLLTGEVSVLATGQHNPAHPFYVGGHLYWINLGSGILANRLVRLEPGAAEPSVLLERFAVSMGAAVDGEAYYLVAKNAFVDGEFYDGAVIRFGHAAQVAQVLASPVTEPSGLSVTSDRVLWVEQVGPNFSGPGRVMSVAKSGGVPVEHATIDDGLGVMVAGDTRDIFFSVFDSDVSRVHRIQLASGTSEVFAETPGSTVVDLALSDDAVVLTTAWSEGTVDGGTPSVTRLCRD